MLLDGLGKRDERRSRDISKRHLLLEIIVWPWWEYNHTPYSHARESTLLIRDAFICRRFMVPVGHLTD